MPRLTSFLALSLLSSTISAESIARVWTHFYPNCPGDAFSKLDTYENYQESAPSEDIKVNSCKNIAVPSYEHSLVSAISVDAELLSHRHDLPFLQGGSGCNITIHEVPGCIDPPLITKEIRDGVAVSQCEQRSFAAYSQIWVNLVCDDESPLHESPPTPSKEEQKQADTQQGVPTNQPDAPVRTEKQTSVEDINNIQTPGSSSNSWSSQASNSHREPFQESRINNAGHSESQQVVHEMMELMKNKTAKIVSGKHNSTRLNLASPNGTTAGDRTMMARRRLSVLRNRVARLI
ncbi:unnamed protein product [Penicillium olsonii]|uniref:Uncharacterized protein n=1 Tax=Penicillium olsonii TaxID=99116 RepID=A0A9W4HG50_PENOL|nr:unnamed protein product [Penicillium olsonii]CAG8002405.1 unnamed protein product [Penicillium olsonii]CAG8038654.1 unnamed protein product [Penicillium olsonii]